jgi:hypothetical protein
MFGNQMMALEERKKALLLESDLNRLRLLAEVNNLREAANISKYITRLSVWGTVLAPLASLIVSLGAGRLKSAGGLLQKAIVAAPVVIRLWRRVSTALSDLRR